MVLGLGEILQGVGLVSSMFGAGKEKVNTTPTSGYATLPDYLKDAYEKVYYPAVMQEFNRPFQMEPTVRYTESDPLFRSQALTNYQTLSDQMGGLFPEFNAPQQPVQAAQPAQQAAMSDMIPALMSGFGNQGMRGTTGNPFFDQLGMQDRINSVIGMNGKVNPFTGETVDAAALQAALPQAVAGGRGLMGVQQASGQLMTPEQQKARDVVFGNIHAASYDPTDTWLSQLAPMIAGTLLAAPLGGAILGLGGAAMPASHAVGMLANQLGTSAVSNLGSVLARGAQ